MMGMLDADVRMELYLDANGRLATSRCVQPGRDLIRSRGVMPRNH